MGTTQPIRDSRQLSQFINYYATTQPNQRNYTLIVIGLHTALRISDIDASMEKCIRLQNDKMPYAFTDHRT